MVSSTGSVVAPLSAYVTVANVQDNQVYQGLTSCLSSTVLKKIYYMVADPGYNNDWNLYDLSMQMGFQLVCPVRRYKTTSSKDFWLISMNLH